MFARQKSQTLADTSIGSVQLLRTEGDILITYDFGGSGTPTLGHLRWVTSIPGNSVSQCFSSNTLPCWGKRVDLSAAGYAAGAVNASGSVSDPVDTPTIQLGANQFGEAAINLTDAGVFPAGQCVNFASAFLKSRSSSSFTAEVKDFVAPGTANISNCGGISIHKTDGTNALAGAGFTLYANGSATGTTCSGTAVGTCTTYEPNGIVLPNVHVPATDSDAGSGITAATIQCTGETATSSFLTHSMTNLLPGSYSCTFVISNN